MKKKCIIITFVTFVVLASLTFFIAAGNPITLWSVWFWFGCK